MVPASVAAEEFRIDRLFVVGDSLSDGGVYSQAIQAGQAAAGQPVVPINYRWTTNALDGSSRTYAEVLGSLLGIDLQPNVISAVPVAQLPEIPVGGTNFSEGGSRVTDPAGIGNSPATGITTIPASQQVDRLLADFSNFGSNDLFVVWAGANDVFAQSGAVGAGALPPDIAIQNMVLAGSQMAGEVDRLLAAGAEQVIVVTVPDIGTTPFGLQSDAQAPGTGAFLTSLGDAFNAQMISDLRGKSAVIVDSGKILSGIQADPTRYGFDAPNAGTVPACQGTSLSCIQGINASADSEQRVFADGVHPTTSAHALFGQAAFAGLEAATQTGAIPVATLTALRLQGLSLENRLNPTVLSRLDENGNRVRRKVGDVDVYASGEAGFYNLDSQQVLPGLKATTQVIRLGADVTVLPNATVGAGISIDHGQVDYDGNRGGFDTRLVVGAVFGMFSISEYFYFNGAVGGGVVDAYNIDRRFRLGPAVESYDAESTGTYFFARAGIGGFFPVAEGFALNPYFNFTRENVTIDGFTESDGIASLSFGEGKYVSNRLTLGLTAYYSDPETLPGWRFLARGSFEHDLKDDDLSVSLGPDPSTLASLPAPRPDQNWGYLQAQAIKRIAPGTDLILGGSGTIGLNGTTGFTGSISIKLDL